MKHDMLGSVCSEVFATIDLFFCKLPFASFSAWPTMRFISSGYKINHFKISQRQPVDLTGPVSHRLRPKVGPAGEVNLVDPTANKYDSARTHLACRKPLRDTQYATNHPFSMCSLPSDLTLLPTPLSATTTTGGGGVSTTASGGSSPTMADVFEYVQYSTPTTRKGNTALSRR